MKTDFLVSVSTKSELIDTQKVSFPIAKMCERTEVSTSEYHKWQNRPRLGHRDSPPTPQKTSS